MLNFWGPQFEGDNYDDGDDDDEDDDVLGASHLKEEVLEGKETDSWNSLDRLDLKFVKGWMRVGWVPKVFFEGFGLNYNFWKPQLMARPNIFEKEIHEFQDRDFTLCLTVWSSLDSNDLRKSWLFQTWRREGTTVDVESWILLFPLGSPVLEPDFNLEFKVRSDFETRFPTEASPASQWGWGWEPGWAFHKPRDIASSWTCSQGSPKG